MDETVQLANMSRGRGDQGSGGRRGGLRAHAGSNANQISAALLSGASPGAGAPVENTCSAINCGGNLRAQGDGDYAAAENNNRLHGHEHLNALRSYIEQLEISLAKKDELLVKKEERIKTLESDVNLMKTASSGLSPVFRTRATDTLLPATPNQVSDDSGEAELERSHNLSHISKAPSLDEESTTEQTASNGRWNIPFDDSFDELVAKSPPELATSPPEKAAAAIGFVPIGEEGRRCLGGWRPGPSPRPSPRVLKTPVARYFGSSPLAQRAVPKSASQDTNKEKENVSPVRSALSVDIGAHYDIR